MRSLKVSHRYCPEGQVPSVTGEELAGTAKNKVGGSDKILLNFSNGSVDEKTYKQASERTFNLSQQSLK